jgi:hypothetical protein
MAVPPAVSKNLISIRYTGTAGYNQGKRIDADYAEIMLHMDSIKLFTLLLFPDRISRNIRLTYPV